MNQCVPLALHVYYGWLAYVLLHAYHLVACEWKFLGKHAYLSSWCLRYGWNDMIFALYCLSSWKIYLKICKTFAKLLFDMPKSYQSHMMILLENHIHICCLFLHWALSNCCDPWEKFLSCIHDQDSRAHHIHLAMLLWEVRIVPSNHPIK